MKHTHLTDDQLIARCVDHDAGLTGCAACDQRHTALAATLDEVTAVSTAEFEAAFPPDRIARQYSRILQRLEQQGRLGRVLAFPLSHAQHASLLRPRPVRRWVAGAAAAGLVIGMAAGHLAHELPVLRGTPAVQQQAGFARPAAVARGSSGLSDDEFLREVELAVGSSGPAALRRIDAVTPVAWEVR